MGLSSVTRAVLNLESATAPEASLHVANSKLPKRRSKNTSCLATLHDVCYKLLKLSLEGREMSRECAKAADDP